MSIALKEASESEYWLELLYKTNYISVECYDIYSKKIDEIIRLLSSIIKTSKLTSQN